MSSVTQKNPIRLFVCHVYHEDDDYHRVFEYLESAANFFYRNTSTPEQRPAGDKEAVRDDLDAKAPRAGCGSCIFLHVWAAPGVPTAGCTAMALDDMHVLAGWLDVGAAPLLVQLPRAAYERCRVAWGLPAVS